MGTMDNQSRNDGGREMNIDVGHLSVTGHVVFAGRDGSVSVNTGGDVAQTNNTTMTVGGVETTRADYDSMVASVRTVDQKIKEDTKLEPDEKAAAAYNLKVVEEQLTSEKPPNPHILVQAARSLYDVSPAIAGAVISLFTEPLVGQIVLTVGGIAKGFYDTVIKGGVSGS
ncbi:MAG: hypothetical protein RLP44_22340 [Aggregatilineales bacterium]